jgi:hypothetical protein
MTGIERLLRHSSVAPRRRLRRGFDRENAVV